MEAHDLLNQRYELVRQLASGGMAHVWVATDTLLGRTVAVKILKEEFTRKPDFQDKFRREAQAIARLSHPCLVTVYDFGVEAERFYMVMEYVEGTDLKTFLRGAFAAGNPPSLETLAGIALQVCEGLGQAHKAGLVHCDVKPQNILLAKDLRPKLTDFGIARAFGTRIDEAGGTAPAASAEKDGTVWGSPQYFAPEQAAGKSLTPASDVYSMGVVFFEMLTGRLPFPGRDPRTLALEHLHEAPPAPRTLNPAIPAALEDIVLRAMAKEPHRRFRNGDQMARVLREYLAHAAPAVEATAELEPEAAEGEEEDGGLDWGAVGLGFLDLITIGGLIPLWVYVYFLYNPPGH